MLEKLKEENGGYVDDDDGCFWETPAEYLQLRVLGFCGCGNPEEVMVYVKEMLEKLEAKEWGAYEDMAYMFFIYWANDKDFAEHGTTARCSWLTDKGHELLNDIKTCVQEEGI